MILVQAAAAAVILIALIGCSSGRKVPPAPALEGGHPIDFNVVRSSIRLVAATLHIPRLFLAIVAISFFWTIGAVLFIQFPPLVKNVLTADKSVASLFLAIFSVGVAIGSVAVNRLLKNQVSARYATPSVLAMGLFVVLFHVITTGWTGLPPPALANIREFLQHPGAWLLLASLLGIAVAGGMFVVPLYAFLTTTVPKAQAARTVAANNIVNSGAMVAGSLIAIGHVRRNERVAKQVLVRRACRGQRGANEHCHSHARHPDLPDDRIRRSGVARARQALPYDGGDVRGRKRVAPRSKRHDNQHAEHDDGDTDHRPRLRRGLARRAQRVDRVHCATPACSSSVRTCASVGA